jgi:hypothetical protein
MGRGGWERSLSALRVAVLRSTEETHSRGMGNGTVVSFNHDGSWWHGRLWVQVFTDQAPPFKLPRAAPASYVSARLNSCRAPGFDGFTRSRMQEKITVCNINRRGLRPAKASALVVHLIARRHVAASSAVLWWGTSASALAV